MLISIPKKFWVNPYGLTKEESEKRKEELRRLSNRNIRIIKNNPKSIDSGLDTHTEHPKENIQFSDWMS